MASKVQCALLLFITLPLAASDGGRKKHEAFVKVILQVKHITQDRLKLYSYFNGFFTGMALQNKLIKPSDMLIFCSSKASDIDAVTQLAHMPATHYINCIIKPHVQTLDAMFAWQSAAEKDSYKIWTWFDSYFNRYGLIEPFKAYQLALIPEHQRSEFGITMSPDGLKLCLDRCPIGIRL